MPGSIRRPNNEGGGREGRCGYDGPAVLNPMSNPIVYIVEDDPEVSERADGAALSRGGLQRERGVAG